MYMRVREKKIEISCCCFARFEASNVGIPHRGERTFLNKIQYGDLIRVGTARGPSARSAQRMAIHVVPGVLVNEHIVYLYETHSFSNS